MVVLSLKTEKPATGFLTLYFDFLIQYYCNSILKTKQTLLLHNNYESTHNLSWIIVSNRPEHYKDYPHMTEALHQTASSNPEGPSLDEEMIKFEGK
jgi:hypothetical protein